MKKVFKNIFLLLLFLASCFLFHASCFAVDLKQSAQSFKEFDYNKATDFSQVGNMVRDDMSGQHFGLSRSISNTADKFLNDYAKSNPRDFSAIANLDKAKEYNDKQNAALKEHLKSEVSKDYSQRMENYLRDHLLKEASGKDLSQIEQMIANVKSQAEAKAKDAVEKMLPSQEKILAERIKTGSSSLDSPFKNFAESLSSSLMNQTGDITKDGLKEFADNQMKDAFGVDKVTDIAGYVNDKVHSAGDLLDKAGDELGINDLKDKLSTGELENQIQKILDKSGLPNPFNLSAGDYISSAKDALNNAAGLDIPMLELPSNAYSVIQIASGVSHFMRAIGFLYIDPTEIKKGRNCLDVAHWALSDKDRAFRIMGGRLGLMDALEIANKYSGASAALAGAAGIDPATLNKLKGAIDKVQNFDLKDFAATKLGLGDVIDELGDVKSKLDEGIANAKGKVTDKLGDLADKTGVKDIYDDAKNIKDEIKENKEKFQKIVEEQRNKVEGKFKLENMRRENTRKDDVNEKSLSDIEKLVESLITDSRNQGMNVAADNLENFLKGNGDRTLDYNWLRSFDRVVDAELVNQERFEKEILERAKTMKDGETITIDSYWDRLITYEGRGFSTEELFWASGDSILTSEAKFALKREGNKVYVEGTVTQNWHDKYDWHHGLGVSIPGYGRIKDEDVDRLRSEGTAREFNMSSQWKQELKGEININKFWFDDANWNWKGP